MAMTTVEELVKYFNEKNKTAFRFGNPTTQNIVNEAMDKKGYSKHDLMEKIEATPSKDIYMFFFQLPVKEATPEVPQAPAMPTSVLTDLPTGNGDGGLLAQSMAIVQKAMADIFMQSKAEEISKGIMGGVEDKVREFIQKEYGTIKKKVEIQMPDKTVILDEQTHEKFEQVLQFVSNNEPVFLCGAAGTGKNVICTQIAKTLGLPFYFSNAVTQEYKITGFTDAMGTFHETQFYKAFKNGGLFMLDEMDASIPEVLIILNAAIANRYFDFPAPIGYVEAHPDFRLVAAGNTYGYGASYQYVGRNALDAASLDRFAVIEIDYSDKIEDACANGNRELVTFIRDFRSAVAKAGVNSIVSYRSITRINKMENSLGTKEVLKTCLLKNLEGDDIRMIASNMSTSNKYTTVVKELANSGRK